MAQGVWKTLSPRAMTPRYRPSTVSDDFDGVRGGRRAARQGGSDGGGRVRDGRRGDGTDAAERVQFGDRCEEGRGERVVLGELRRVFRAAGADAAAETGGGESRGVH